MKFAWIAAVAAAAFVPMLGGCVEGSAQAPPSSPQPQRQAEAPQPVKVDAAQVQRLQRIMTPLIQRMDRPLALNQVKMTVLNDSHINAANGGGGDFYVTTGLLQRANDNQLRAILAHEVAHADLGHVAKAQALGAGLEIGMVLLDQIFPGSGALTPIAGQLVANAYSRQEETAADAHGVAILRRAGFDGKALMASTLSWLAQSEGDSGGGFFASHPATGDRVQAIQALP